MRSLHTLTGVLESLASPDHYIFAASDLRSVLPKASDAAYRSVLHRAVKTGVLERVCRGIYLAPRVAYTPGLVLYHVAGRLRAGLFV